MDPLKDLQEGNRRIAEALAERRRLNAELQQLASSVSWAPSPQLTTPLGAAYTASLPTRPTIDLASQIALEKQTENARLLGLYGQIRNDALIQAQVATYAPPVKQPTTIERLTLP